MLLRLFDIFSYLLIDLLMRSSKLLRESESSRPPSLSKTQLYWLGCSARSRTLRGLRMAFSGNGTSSGALDSQSSRRKIGLEVRSPVREREAPKDV